jgi:predicted nucleic acid-binding protein
VGSIVSEIGAATAVGIDTAPLIYYFERHPEFFPAIDPVIQWVAQRSDVTLYTSVISLIETTTFPLRQGRHDLVAKYRNALLHTADIHTLPLDAEIAHRSAELRAKYRLNTPDAVQLATCIHVDCSVFITNDRGLQSVTEIPVIYLADYILTD